jgi:hypothetical protein
MARHLELIDDKWTDVEKRVFPRFPFSFLTFKSTNSKENKVFEVKDISTTGMQLCLKDGGHNFDEGSKIKGNLHWLGEELEADGTIKWVTSSRIGFKFQNNKKTKTKLEKFLSIKKMAGGLRAIHNIKLDIEIPSKLKYWLRSDGPVEIFVWHHSMSDYAKFQIIILDKFIEWVDGKGLQTGQVLTKRDLETPLMQEDEFYFKIDRQCNRASINMALELISHISEGKLSEDAKDFLVRKLSA